MSDTEPPSSSSPRRTGQTSPQDPDASRAFAFPSANPGFELEASSGPGSAHPWLNRDTMRTIYARAQLLVTDVPQQRAQGYRLIAVHADHVSWVDIRLCGDGYAVLGSHARCDLVLRDTAGVRRRHLAAVAVRLADDGLGVRLFGLNTNVPFLVEDETPRMSDLARGRFAVRLDGYVVCGFPVVFLDALRGGAANDGAVQAVSVVEPSPVLGPVRPIAPTSQGPTRLLFARGTLGAAIELPAEMLDEGVLLGRSRTFLNAGLRRVLSDEAISTAHLLLLRRGVDVFAYDLCSTNGTRVRGQCIRRHRVTSAEPTLELGTVTLTIRA